MALKCIKANETHFIVSLLTVFRVIEAILVIE